MFIESSLISVLAPFEGAESNQTSYHSRITPLLRIEPEWGGAACYRDLIPNRGEAFIRQNALSQKSD